jgi:hypothetical protein
VPAEADLSPSDRYFSFQFFEAVVFKADVVFHEVFDVIEILVYLAEAVEPRFGFARSSEVAQKIPCLCKFLG